MKATDMNRRESCNVTEGTSARQLALLDDEQRPLISPRQLPRTHLRLLRKDLYAELDRRRRRAQIAARHLVD